MFWTDTIYKNSKGDKIIERQYMSDTGEFNSTRLFGCGCVVINTPMGELSQEYEVPLDLDGVDEEDALATAFQLYESQMEEKSGPAADAAYADFAKVLKAKLGADAPSELQNFDVNDPFCQ